MMFNYNYVGILQAFIWKICQERTKIEIEKLKDYGEVMNRPIVLYVWLNAIYSFGIP